MHERHIVSDDSFSKLGDLVEEFAGGKMKELMPGRRDALLGPTRQDILEVVRMKNDPVGYQARESLKIMAEVRSYYDCK